MKFEEVYADLQLKIEVVAEGILTLGQAPQHRYSDYKKMSKIEESAEVSDGEKALHDIVKSFQSVISIQRKVLIIYDEAGDEGTNALMTVYIRKQEKLVCRYSLFLAS